MPLHSPLSMSTPAFPCAFPMQVVAAAKDLKLINMIQAGTGIDFFEPYGPHSSSIYTTVAPNDQAIITAMTGERRGRGRGLVESSGHLEC